MPQSRPAFSSPLHKCKWLHCLQAFGHIDGCITHEYEQFGGDGFSPNHPVHGRRYQKTNTMQILKNIKFVERDAFARGGCAALYYALLTSEDPSKCEMVAVKVPDRYPIASGRGAEYAEAMAKKQQRWQREIAAGQSVSHPNVLALLGFCDNPDPDYKDFVGIVLPFCKNGNARSYIQEHPEVDRLRVIISVAAALFALHSRSSPVVHGDIKASNILIDDEGQPLLSDFGLSRVCYTKGFTTKTIMGSIRWMSPELLHAWTASPQDASIDDRIVRTTRASDVWAFGMTILEVLTGNVPFSGYFDPGVVVGVVSHKARPEKPCKTYISDTLWTLLERCWAEEPSNRPDARHVGLVLDIIYGNTRREVDVHTMSVVLAGTLDDVVPEMLQSQPGSSSLPYKCKWLHCSQAFEHIDGCIAHECEEFERRRIGPSL